MMTVRMANPAPDVVGLSSAEAARRLQSDGPNDTAPAEGHRGLLQLVSFVANPLVVILLLAAVASFFLGDRINGAIIVALVLFSTVLDSVQNARSRIAVRKLQSEVAPQATVMRDGTWKTLPRREVVVGDVVRLTAGDLVPADAKLLEERELHVQESALTGESMPVEKEVGTGNDDEHVFLGTAVVSGTATALVEATGVNTRFGKIVVQLGRRAPESDFERGLREFGMLIMRLVIFLVLFVTAAMLFLHRDPFQSLLFGVALAVGLTPEFLPMITSLTLGKGAVRMSRHKVIVKNLASIQNLGSMDVLCSDKTGTLTSGEMSLEHSVDPTGKDSTEPERLGKLNALFQTGVPTALDAAVLEKAGKDEEGYAKVDEVPFDFERRRVSVVVEKEGQRLLVCKGAPEGVFSVCKAVPNEAVKLADGYGNDGYRVLAVASRPIGEETHYGPEDETGLELAGFLLFLDPPLPDALDVLHRLKASGIEVKVITGDSEAVSRHVCQSIGLDPGEIVLGDRVESLSEKALGILAEKTTVFARVNPTQKDKIILALKHCGHVVGYMGDGINDAPSLHTADVGISFSGATDVAKDAAQIILVERDLMLLHKGVLEGRVAFGNVMKYLFMGTSSNFGNMFSMAGAALFLPFLPMLPTQILLNNLMYDLAQVTIPSDQVDSSYLRKPKRWDIALVRDFMVWIGPISSVFDFLTFWVLLQVFHASEREFHAGWFVESVATQTLVIFVIRTSREPWKSRPSRPLAFTVLLMVGLSLVLPFTGVGKLLGFDPLPPAYFGFLALATGGYLVIVDLVKRRLMARYAA
ncbi:MAG: magnesium-translocating P-type ATPase [Armatimonadetes bacterium]|nr:magnesium-translocating P-type ATPase [Armatimonadota bacterium]